MKTKTPFSIELLMSNKKHHLATLKSAKQLYKVYKNRNKGGFEDEMEKVYERNIVTSKKYLDDINLALKKLSK